MKNLTKYARTPPNTSIVSYFVFPSTTLSACHRSALSRNLGSATFAQATRWFSWSTVVMISNADCFWNKPGSSMVGGRWTGAIRRYLPSAGIWSETGRGIGKAEFNQRNEPFLVRREVQQYRPDFVYVRVNQNRGRNREDPIFR
ncbi:hypothetical protein LshimejAT787_1601510 [Lyophyllum shimeji]|uniref:Uncharacterized protein n=1 Tax=Lyophyllum shimeji TaxID=47721 RepID=A0A9P3PZZ7_LYOSH|nr:hypothetical protein LshimejAT787_1601510 [Lyophyllum shimeji]